MRMRSCLRIQAHAKINWCLAVTGRDERGYHLLDMLMQRVSLYDTLYATPAEDLSLNVIGDPVEGAPEKNLVLRAANMLRSYNPNAGARLTLVKRIPQGAGLGGGSSDAASALRLLNRLWNLNLDYGTLSDIALRLGADVPFFMKGEPARVQGIGEKLIPVSLPEGIPLVLVKASAGLNTGLVYSRSDSLPVEPTDVSALLSCLMSHDLKKASQVTGNALYPAAVSLSPSLENTKRALEASGALYVLMTGSGAVVYGAYASDSEACRAAQELQKALPGAYVAVVHTIN